MSVLTIDGYLAYTTANGTLYFAGGPKANCTVEVCPVALSVYGYRPSLAESGVLIGLYGICMIV